MRVQIVFSTRLFGNSCAPSVRLGHWRFFRGADGVVRSLILQQPQGATQTQLNEKSCLFQIKKVTHSASSLLHPQRFMITPDHPIAHNIRNLDIATSSDAFAMKEGLAPRCEGNVLWLRCLLISPKSVFIIFARRTARHGASH